MVCSALRGLFVYRTELKRPVDRYHPPCSLSCAACWGTSWFLRVVVYAFLVPLDLRADGCTVLTGVTVSIR
jgi:hypothetical protein